MANKSRVADIAQRRGTSVDDVLAHLKRAGVAVNDAEDTVDDAVVEKAYAAGSHRRPTRGGRGGGRKRRVVIDAQASRRGGKGGRRKGSGGDRHQAEVEEPAPIIEPGQTVTVPSGASVKEVSELLAVSTADVIKTMMGLGEMVTITQSLSDEAIELLGDEFKRTVEIAHAADETTDEAVPDDDPKDLRPRAPVITVMGHVDHGKTSLLDAVRETEVAAGEAGGITQHIGAYQVMHDGKQITFVDTPGHEAFTAMRARGAKVTDIAVIVVAADDGVMPQTVEAIDHAKAAGVPIVIAVNKIDKPEANPDRVKQQLTEQGIVPEDWGGEHVFVDVSAKKKTGLDDFLEMLLLVAEVADLKANPDTSASGYIVESRVDPGRGVVATMLVSRGTLHVGDGIVAGVAAGKVRAMRDFHGEPLTGAGPATPVEIIGFDQVPNAGEFCRVVDDEKTARAVAQKRANRIKAEALAREHPLTLDDLYARIAEGRVQELGLIVKADVQGSLEALQDALDQIEHDEVKLRVIRSGVGAVSESDVMLAAASEAIIIGFNVRPNPSAASLADREGVDIRTYRVIYKATEDIRAALRGMLRPEYSEEVTGSAEVRQTFRASRIGTIAGCYVTDGSISRNSGVRLLRDGTVVHEGRIASLKRFQDDVKEVQQGFECGILLDGFNDIKEDDVIEAYEKKEVEREE